MHTGRASFALAFVGLACAKDPPAGGPVAVDVSQTDGAASIATYPSPPPSPAASASPAARASAGPLAENPPPSGEYAVTVDVRADTCASGAAPAPASLLVPMHLSKGAVYGNFPFPPFAGSPFGTNRADVTLDPPPPPKISTQHPLGSSCLGYIAKETTTVLDAARDTIRLVVTTDYGDVAACATPPRGSWPSKCHREIAYTYKLTRADCEAKCNASMTFPPNGGPATISCRCP